MEILPVLFIIILALAIYINCIIAKNFQNIATLKGFNNKKYFWFCFWLGVVGYFMVIALPNNNNIPKEKTTTLDESAE